MIETGQTRSSVKNRRPTGVAVYKETYRTRKYPDIMSPHYCPSHIQTLPSHMWTRVSFHLFPLQPQKPAGPWVGLWSMCGLPLVTGGLFIHLHTVAADHTTWPGGDSLLLRSHPAALQVRRAIRGSEELKNDSPFFIPPALSSSSCCPSIHLSTPLLSHSFHFFMFLFMLPFLLF